MPDETTEETPVGKPAKQQWFQRTDRLEAYLFSLLAVLILFFLFKEGGLPTARELSVGLASAIFMFVKGKS
ncbi:MAG: hypothetical protein GY757_18875 [bacterium]|nr:hypothetical protein [bacterium]